MKFPQDVLKQLKTAQPIGTGLSLFEIEDNSREYHIFHIAKSEDYYFIVSICNVGLILDAWMDIDKDMSEHYHLEGLFEVCQKAALFNDGEIETEPNGEVII